MAKQQICILGSTGSIGRQALDVISQHPDLYEAYCLTANSSVDLLAEQARQFRPACVVIANEQYYDDLKDKLSDCPEIKVYAGKEALCQVVESDPINVVLASMVGFAGLVPTIHAIKAGKKIALANKETLVVAGELMLRLVQQYHVDLLPVDSEHSAIFQSLVGEDMNEVDKILLTCSGGPFRLFDRDRLATVTAADALKHPTWDMGAKITIDSASLMNKGFEVMEARWLFGVPADHIQVLIHPQSIVHSGVQFKDGAVKAQLGVPDMRLPIQYAFSYPRRLTLQGDRLDLFKAQRLEFFEPDVEKFPCLRLAYEAIAKGGNMPCILNAANEVANAAFRRGECSFLGMADIIEKTMQQVAFDAKVDLDLYLDTDREAREVATRVLRAQ
jgi:1-deoxy-D-xylulose-5-phosphate reductoisomerase